MKHLELIGKIIWYTILLKLSRIENARLKKRLGKAELRLKLLK